MKCPRISKAIAVDDTTLVVKFDNQQIKKYDIRRLWDIPMFFPLKKSTFFKNFKIEKGGYGLVWNEDIDLSEYELWTNGETLAENEDFPAFFKNSDVEIAEQSEIKTASP